MLTLAAPGIARAQPVVGDPACEVALSVMTVQPRFDRPLAFISDPPSTKDRFADYTVAFFVHRRVDPPPSAPEDPNDEAYGWYKDPPSEDLARRFLASDDSIQLLTACPGLRDRFAAMKIVIDPKDDPRPRRSGHFRHVYVALGLPVVSEDGLEALVALDQTFGPLAGGGSLLHLRRVPGGPWREVDALFTWVS